MTTPVELINLALKQAGVLGVGQTATAEDLSDCFKLYNMMLAQWSRMRNIVYQLLDVACVGTGAQTYTVGIGGNFDIPRPSKLIGAYCRQLSNPGLQVDFPLDLLMSQTDWGRVSPKAMTSLPSLVYYDPQYPLGVLHVWPVPDSKYEIHIQCLADLPRTVTSFDDILMPPEYEEAIMYNLAGRLCIFYQIPLPQGLPQLASATMATLRAANMQIGKLYMPDNLAGNGGAYNVYTDSAR